MTPEIPKKAPADAAGAPFISQKIPLNASALYFCMISNSTPFGSISRMLLNCSFST